MCCYAHDLWLWPCAYGATGNRGQLLFATFTTTVVYRNFCKITDSLSSFARFDMLFSTFFGGKDLKSQICFVFHGENILLVCVEIPGHSSVPSFLPYSRFAPIW